MSESWIQCPGDVVSTDRRLRELQVARGKERERAGAKGKESHMRAVPNAASGIRTLLCSVNAGKPETVGVMKDNVTDNGSYI